MRLAREDTTAPRLTKLEARDGTHLSMEFSEALDSASVSISHFTVVDTLSLNPLKVFSIYPSADAQRSFRLVTEPQDSEKTYRLSVDNVRDLAGNPIHESARRLSVRGSAKKDSVGLRFASASLKDSTTGTVPNPVFFIKFTDAAKTVGPSSPITIEDTLGARISATVRWMDDISASITPMRLLSYKKWYRLKIFMREMRDVRGAVSKDSTRTFRFQTIEEDAFSSIEGSVTDFRTRDTTGNIVVLASKIGSGGMEQFSAVASSTGAFVFSQLGEGTYIVQAFRDRNGNGLYDSGKPFPYVPSERLSPQTDTLKVRARWPLEGVKVELR